MDSATPLGQSWWQRPPVIIIGAHRSGTTATARALELLGLLIGQKLDSHRESKALQSLHENYLHRLGAAWHNPATFLEQIHTLEGERDCLEYLRNNTQENFAGIFCYRNSPRGLWLRGRLKRGAAWGWKEPRTTLFAPLWLQLFPEARIIDVIRDPLSVAMSIRRRELRFRAAGDPPTPHLDDLDYCLRLALSYVELGERLASRTPYYRRVRFEEIQAAPRTTLESLADFCALHVTRAQIAKSAASIKPGSLGPWSNLSREEAGKLLSTYPIVAKLGYGPKSPQ